MHIVSAHVLYLELHLTTLPAIMIHEYFVSLHVLFDLYSSKVNITDLFSYFEVSLCVFSRHAVIAYFILCLLLQVGIYMPCYDLLRNRIEEYSDRNCPKLRLYAPLISGSIARSLACIACSPIELARTRMLVSILDFLAWLSISIQVKITPHFCS